jgi:hypothetical protein
VLLLGLMNFRCGLLVSQKLLALCQGDHPALVATPRFALYVVRNKRRVLTLARVTSFEHLTVVGILFYEAGLQATRVKVSAWGMLRTT